jgi:hypothetical protein
MHPFKMLRSLNAFSLDAAADGYDRFRSFETGTQIEIRIRNWSAVRDSKKRH